MKRRAVVLRIVLALALAAAVAVGACHNEPTGPTSGPLLVALSGAGSSDHALLIELSGADTTARIDTVQAASGAAYQVFVQRQSGTRWRVIVTGAIANGTLFQIGIPDKSRSTAYSGTVLDVANASFVDLAPGGRRLTVSP
jgi:hypothetical protein